MKRSLVLIAPALLAVLTVLACGSSHSSSSASDAPPPAPPPAAADAAPPSAPPDGGPAPDNGAPSDVYPAPHPDPAQVVSLGGKIVAAPSLVPVVFASDPLAADIDAMIAQLDTTTYWADAVKDYGIAKPTAVAPIHVTDVLPAKIDDKDVKAFIKAHLEGAHAGFPAPSDEMFLTLIYPPNVTISVDSLGESCTAFHGYHSNVTLADGRALPYAVVSRCATIPEAPVTGIQYVSAVMSHEVIEGFADPDPLSKPAFAQTDGDHIAFSIYPGAEIGDMCALIGDAFYTPTDFPYTVQRIWSNSAAKTGHDPCIPQPKTGEPYFAVAPILPDSASLPNGDGTTTAAKSVKIPNGQSRTIDVLLYSDGPTSAAWSVKAVETGLASGDAPSLAFTFDRTMGRNGEKLHLTIKTLRQLDQNGGATFLVVSKLGTRRSLAAGLVTY